MRESDTWIGATLLSRRERKHRKTIGGLSESYYESWKIHLVLCAILGPLFVSVWNGTGAAAIIIIIATQLFYIIAPFQKEKRDISHQQHAHFESSDWSASYQAIPLRWKGRNFASGWQQLLLSKRESTNYQLEHATYKRHAQYKHPWQRRD